MEKVLKLYTLDGGNNVIPFPNSDNQIEIGDFRYDAKRMSGAPTISATAMYESCLDEVWNENVFAEFNGERYYLKSTPTSSYSNEDERYRHELELVSERVILDNVYFYDAVVANVPSDDKPKSNSAKVVFSGNIHEFVRRLNSSLAYSGLQTVDGEGNYVSGYRAIVDESVTDEETQFMSFEDQFFSNVIQEIYNTYNLPYYFKGKEIHIGFEDTVIQDTLEYGVDNALLSITKQNANFKIVNRATGKGSSDNIPYYYPNNSPKGEIAATCSSENFTATVVDYEKYANTIELEGSIRRSTLDYSDLVVRQKKDLDYVETYSGEDFLVDIKQGKIENTYRIHLRANETGELTFSFESEITKYFKNPLSHASDDFTYDVRYRVYATTVIQNHNPFFTSTNLNEIDNLVIPIPEANKTYYIHIYVEFVMTGKYSRRDAIIEYRSTYSFGSKTGWSYKDRPIELSEAGLRIEGTPSTGDTITQTLVKKVNTSDVLLPSIYRATDGKQRFYNAKNDNYIVHEDVIDPETGEVVDSNFEVDLGGHTFNNEYNGHNPKEHIITVEDIKPTIKDATYTDPDNGTVYNLDRFLEFAYDNDDNNETYEDEEGKTNYKHSFFFAKLPPLGFNLFNHSIEQQPMVISFTSGQCASCEFEIAVSEAEEGETRQYNLVQVDSNGNLLRDESGRVICGVEDYQSPVEPQEIQNDTTNNSVWIALRKEDKTFGHIMPLAPKIENGEVIEAGYRPTSDDTFVILGINLPLQYILNAEQKLEEEIIKYLKENNEEKFNFSINFSRIFFEENPQYLDPNSQDYINENSRLRVKYDGKEYLLYVSSFSYNMSQDEVLPQITVELDDELTITQNALQNAISQVKSDVGKALGSLDVLGLATPYFLRKDADDEARGKINFKKGVKFGEGGKVEILDNNSAKLTIEYLEVTKKATFTSLEIQERTHVGGQLLVTPAALNCGEVEEFADRYRCYFQTKGENGDEIFNQFVVGDQAISQTFNAWGSRYYWRLVVGVGEDYIDLSKSDCDEDSDVPMEGDKIIQFGNRDNEERQNAIVLAAHGEGSPYFIQYQGINSFEVPEDKVVTKLSPHGNLITGTVKFLAGSSGIENIEGINDFGGANLLRNTGFTGDYLSKQLEGEVTLAEGETMFSPPLDHWEDSSNIEVIETNESSSGYGVQLGGGGVLTQVVDLINVVAGDTYTVSLKARTTVSTSDVITVSFAGASAAVEIGDAWERHIVNVVAGATNVFTITGASVELCDLQLEHGAIATAWKSSFKDNASELAYWQSTQIVSGAIKDASTTINGGLVLTNTIMVGNYDPDTKEMTEVTGGMSGHHEDDNDVVFWGGGTLQQAIATVMKYENDPTYQPTQEELVGMAKFVVTHGGRAILNDIILRGIIYSQGGEIAGFKIENDGLKYSITDENGVIHNVYLTQGGLDIQTSGCNDSSLGTRRMWFGNAYGLCPRQAIYARSTLASDECTLQIDQSGIDNSEQDNIAISVTASGNSSENVAVSINEFGLHGKENDIAIRIGDGVCEGIRHRTVVATDAATYQVPTNAVNVIVNNSQALILWTPEAYQNGTMIEILHITENRVTISQGSAPIYNMNTKTTGGFYSDNVERIRLIYSSEVVIGSSTGAWVAHID